MEMVIAFVSQKGGVGKSTLARALAREAAAGELLVKVADLDTQQGTSLNWGRRRVDAGIEPRISVESFKTAKQALGNVKECDLLILDGPARASSATLEISQAANMIVQPTGAALDDLEPAVLLFHELSRAGIPKKNLVFALCRVGTPAEEMDARNYISRAGYQVLDGALYERAAYRQAQNEGFAVTETRYSTLNEKADLLIQSLVNLLDEKIAAINT